MADSPIERLCRLIPLLKDTDNRVLVPGFYDDVKALSAADAAALADLPFDASAAAENIGLEGLAGDPLASPLEKRLLQPTLNVNGFRGGYIGKGSKTIIPSQATMKMDFRLVDAQQPEKIYAMFKAFLEAEGFGDLEVTHHGMMTPWRTPVDHPAAEPVMRAVEKGFGEPPYRVPSLGGSLPLAAFTQLGAPIFLVPYAQDDEHNHSPNESMGVENYINGIRTMAALIGGKGERAGGRDR
jgi:acetylornithine deacetylase/succinyl-diaminopimelate desuccinylase-like protein